METIELKHALPEVFASRNDIDSDVWHQDVKFEKQHLYLIEANSGTGKSSLCSYIFGYRTDYQGIICFDDNNIKNLTIPDWVEIRKRHISLLFQELRLFPELTALENVKIKNALTGFKKMKQIKEWFDMLGIAPQMNQLVGHMSFGQQQRVAMIRSLCQPFDFIFADEPVSHLDDENSRIMSDVMMTEAYSQGAGVICTSVGKHMELNYDKTYRL